MTNKLKYWVVVYMVLFGLAPTLAHAQNTYPILEKQIKKQQYKQAYQQARMLLSQNEGDPRFDYLYGFSALQTGHYNEAVFALDRVTVSTPNVIRPRLELARAYLKLNNKTAAIKEFNDVLALSPPPIVRQKVMTYISELLLGDRLIAQSVTKRLFSFSMGYDDNINFGSESSNVDLPDFGRIVLDPSAIKQGSGFAEAKFQIKRQKLKNKTRSTFLLANLTHKKYFKQSDFDLSDFDLRAGVTLNKRNKQYQLIARARPVFLGGNFNSNTIGVDAIARKALKKGSVVSATISADKFDSKVIPLSDRSRVILSGRWDKQVGDIQHQFNAYLGKEFPDDKKGKQFSRNISGVSYSGIQEWNDRNRTFFGVDYRHYKHQGKYPVFPEKRVDDQVVLKAGHEWQMNDNWSLIFSAKHTKNKSNLDLYDLKRNEIKVGIRYDWD